jgi:hypothetical protein
MGEEGPRAVVLWGGREGWGKESVVPKPWFQGGENLGESTHRYNIVVGTPYTSENSRILDLFEKNMPCTKGNFVSMKRTNDDNFKIFNSRKIQPRQAYPIRPHTSATLTN